MTSGVAIEAGGMTPATEDRLVQWAAERFAARLWEKDPTLWFPDPVPELADRLGWLELPERMARLLPELADFRAEVTTFGFRDVVLIGMGGSSLAPEVFGAVLGGDTPKPGLTIMDSTHPVAVRAVEDSVDLDRALFIISSKSGTTLETLSLFHYFWERVATSDSAPGDRFVAVTDPGSPLETTARARGFLRVFSAPSDVGGRYSALSEFGLVPAAAIGIDVESLQRGAAEAASACGPEAQGAANPGLALGAFLGEHALAGRDKATFVTPDALRPLTAWIEQLIAESTGKEGRGIVPIGGDDASAAFGPDRCFVFVDSVTADQANAPKAASGERAGAHLRLSTTTDLGGAMFVLEVATAAAGAVLGIHPFNQPDVQLAKDLAKRAMQGDLDTSHITPLDALDPELPDRVASWLAGVAPPEYVGIHAYLPPTPATHAALETARRAVRDGRSVAATFDFGPRFLHSTGQLHKGGPPTGRFLQVIDDARPDLAVPESDLTFGRLIRAQALGDHQALTQRGRRVLLVSLGESGADGLEALLNAVARAARS